MRARPASAAVRRHRGRQTLVARLLGAFATHAACIGFALWRVTFNGKPGALFRDRAGALINVVVLGVAHGAISAVRSIVNPDKLRHVGPLSALPQLKLLGLTERRVARSSRPHAGLGHWADRTIVVGGRVTAAGLSRL